MSSEHVFTNPESTIFTKFFLSFGGCKVFFCYNQQLIRSWFLSLLYFNLYRKLLPYTRRTKQEKIVKKWQIRSFRIRENMWWTHYRSMQSQRHKMGVYKTIGKMNGQLVYKQLNRKEADVNYVFSWHNKQDLIQW